MVLSPIYVPGTVRIMAGWERKRKTVENADLKKKRKPSHNQNKETTGLRILLTSLDGSDNGIFCRGRHHVIIRLARWPQHAAWTLVAISFEYVYTRCDRQAHLSHKRHQLIVLWQEGRGKKSTRSEIEPCNENVLLLRPRWEVLELINH